MKRCICLTLCLLLILAGCLEEAPPQTTGGTQITATPTESEPVPQEPRYVFRDSMTAVPRNFDPHNWTSDSDRYVLELTAPGLYAIGLGGALLPEMAASEPVDVTAEFAGNETYGVPTEAGEGYAFTIDLHPDAVWEDGTPINAETYADSMKKLLDSARKNSRAAVFCGGTLAIANAGDYYMQDEAGKVTYLTLEEAGYASVSDAQADGLTRFYLDMDSFWNLDCGWLPITDETLYRDEAVAEGSDEDYVSASYLYQTYLAEGAAFSAYQRFYVGIPERSVPVTDWADVGFFASGEYQITLVLEKPVAAEYLMYSLTSSFLVPEMYDGVDYGTSAERYLSTGPYRLAQAGEFGVIFERNESWYGYTDGRHEGQYQTTDIVCAIMDHAQALEAFEAGELDTVTLATGDMGKYADDPRLMLTAQSYTSKLTFNSDFDALKTRQSEGINKTILADPEFRQGIALSIDRAAFVEQCLPMHEPGWGLLNSQYICDPAAGLAYRDTEQGKAVLERAYGTSESAAELLTGAYDRALAAGQIGETDVIELEFLVYSGEDTYVNMTAFLQDSLDAATAGTALEGQIRIKMTVAEDYYSLAQLGHFEIILSTLGGSVMDPYSMMRYYCRAELLFEYGFDPAREQCAITIGGETVTQTYAVWELALNEGQYRDADTGIRLTILAALEQGLLEGYRCVPLYSRNTAVLMSQKITAELCNFRYVTYRNDES